MTKLEQRIRSGLHEAAERIPEPAADNSPLGETEAKPVPAKRTLRPSFVLPVVVVAVFLLATPLIWLQRTEDTSPAGSPPVLDQPEEPSDTTLESTTSITGLPDSDGLPVFQVTEVDSSQVNPSTQPDDSISTSVNEILEGTGKTYNPLPGHVADIAVTGGRVVVVGGNETRSIGIWYSDGGEWTPAEIELPAGVTFGGQVGDYELGDGVEHLEVMSDSRLVAWQPIQQIDTFETEEQGVFVDTTSAGTIVLGSDDGATWQAEIIDHNITAMDTFDTGVIAAAVTRQQDGRKTAVAFWSTDLTTWTKVADLGEGEPRHVETDDQGATITLTVWEVNTNDDGSISHGPGASTRHVRLTQR